MKILFVFFWPLPSIAGGVWTYLSGLKESLGHLGYHVDILSPHPEFNYYYLVGTDHVVEKNFIKEQVYNRINPFYQSNFPMLLPWIRNIEFECYSLELALTLFNLEQYDLIHVHDIYSARAVSRVKPSNVPIVSTLHGCLATEYLIRAGKIKSTNEIHTVIKNIDKDYVWRLFKAYEWYGATSCERTIVPSKWLKQLLVDYVNIPSDYIKVIPYGINIGSFLNHMKGGLHYGSNKNKTVIICPARLDEVKGHKYLLDALSELLKDSKDWVCWIVGDGLLRKSLEDQTNKLGLQDFVKFFGNRNDVPTLMKNSDIVVLPSLQDNQPFVVIEGQVAGKPVVVTDAGGLPEMVEHNETGLIVPAGNSHPLYKNLK
ncbi:glycosyltransferase family 4 protein, partial [Bacillus sp. JJ1521]|uniref:glycosyltransferase family 4 protein n=1 Tax=Bacillus sp. JJ1521 TaxID=3122957 RepID=UPI002FFF81C5